MTETSEPRVHRSRFDGKRYQNIEDPVRDKTVKDLWRWYKNRNAAKWPKKVPVRPAAPPSESHDLHITHVGHSTFLIQTDRLNILTDPVWARRAGPMDIAGPKRVTAPGVRFRDLPRIDIVLVSHNHYDHLDASTVKRLDRLHRPTFVTPIGNTPLLHRLAPASEVASGDWGDSIALKQGRIVIDVTGANHWSRRGIKDTRKALWASFMIRTESHKIWFAGDTGYGSGEIFRRIRDALGAPDVALIPIGAYEPRWFMKPQHVNPEEAVRIFLDIGAKHALGMHWGTFQLTDEAREQPVIDLQTALNKFGIPNPRFQPAEPGKSWYF